MPNTITKNETVVQCSPITCMVAGATLNEESNAEALDTYTACGCEGASGASGLKNLLGGAAPFLIPFAAGFASHGENGVAWLQILSNRATELERKRDFQKATQTWLELAARYGEQHDLQGELTALNRADNPAKKIKDEGARNNLRAEILEKMSDAHAELTEYAWAVDKMRESLKLSASEARYERLVKLINLGVTAGQIEDIDGDAIREEASKIWFSAATRGKKARGPAVDKGVAGQWVSDLAKGAGGEAGSIFDTEKMKGMIDMWTNTADKLFQSDRADQLSAASRLYEKLAHVFQAFGLDREASKAYAAAADAVLRKGRNITAADHQRAAELLESAVCEEGPNAALRYGAAGRNRLDAAKILALAGDFGQALANVQMAIVDFAGGFETADQLKEAKELQTELIGRLVQEAPAVREHLQVKVKVSTMAEFLKGGSEGDWDKASADQRLNWMETVQKAAAFALKNHMEELAPFIKEVEGQGRVLNVEGCAKAMELWVKTTDRMERGPLRTGGADLVVDGVVNSLLGRYGDTSDEPAGMPEMPGRADMPGRPTAIGREPGRKGRAEGRGFERDGSEKRGAKGRGKARKGPICSAGL